MFPVLQNSLWSLFFFFFFFQNCRPLFPCSFELNNGLSKSQNPWEVIIPKVEDKGPANVQKWKKWQMCFMVKPETKPIQARQKVTDVFYGQLDP